MEKVIMGFHVGLSQGFPISFDRGPLGGDKPLENRSSRAKYPLYPIVFYVFVVHQGPPGQGLAGRIWLAGRYLGTPDLGLCLLNNCHKVGKRILN